MDPKKEFEKIKKALADPKSDKKELLDTIASTYTNQLQSSFKDFSKKIRAPKIKLKHDPLPDVDLSLLFTPPKPVSDPESSAAKREPANFHEHVYGVDNVPESMSASTPLPDAHSESNTKQHTSSTSKGLDLDELVSKVTTDSMGQADLALDETPISNAKQSEKNEKKKRTWASLFSLNFFSSNKRKNKKTTTKKKQRVSNTTDVLVTDSLQDKIVAKSKTLLKKTKKNPLADNKKGPRQKSGQALEQQFKERQKRVSDMIKGDKGSMSDSV